MPALEHDGLLARGFHDWFVKEIREDRVLWPRIGISAPRVVRA